METRFGNVFHLFVMLAVVMIIVIEHLPKQAVLAQLISATLLVLLCVTYIVTIHELEQEE